MLRESTRGEHDAVDRSLSRLDLADAVSYRRFLRIHLDALTVLAVRCAARDRADVAQWIDCLRRDLSTDGPDRGTPGAAVAGRVADGCAEVGVAYVVRGSRLGAAVLIKRVPAGFPTRYLAHRPTVSWGAFVERLDAFGRRADDRQRIAVVAAARAAFSVFAMAAPSAAGRP